MSLTSSTCSGLLCSFSASSSLEASSSTFWAEVSSCEAWTASFCGSLSSFCESLAIFWSSLSPFITVSLSLLCDWVTGASNWLPEPSSSLIGWPLAGTSPLEAAKASLTSLSVIVTSSSSLTSSSLSSSSILSSLLSPSSMTSSPDPVLSLSKLAEKKQRVNILFERANWHLHHSSFH